MGFLVLKWWICQTGKRTGGRPGHPQNQERDDVDEDDNGSDGSVEEPQVRFYAGFMLWCTVLTTFRTVFTSTSGWHRELCAPIFNWWNILRDILCYQQQQPNRRLNMPPIRQPDHPPRCFYTKIDWFRSKNDEFCIKNEEFCPGWRQSGSPCPSSSRWHRYLRVPSFNFWNISERWCVLVLAAAAPADDRVRNHDSYRKMMIFYRKMMIFHGRMMIFYRKMFDFPLKNHARAGATHSF